MHWLKRELEGAKDVAVKFGKDLVNDFKTIGKRTAGIETEENEEEDSLSIPSRVLSSSGIKFGYGKTDWRKREVAFKQGDHYHKVAQGKSDSGKSTFAVNYCIQLAKEGRGFAYLDNKDGKAINDMLLALPDRVLKNRVILLDHSDRYYPIGLGVSQSETNDIFTQSSVANQWVDFFCNNYGIEEQFRTQELIRFACRAVFTTRNATIWDVVKMVKDKQYKAYILNKLDNNKHKNIIEWWNDFEEKSEKQQQNIAASFLTRAGIILSRPILKCTLGATPRKPLNYYKWMNNNKIVLIRATGKLGSQTAIRNIMGMHMLGFWRATLKRENIPESKRQPFMIVADEPQTWLSNNEHLLDEIFSKARSYKVGIFCLFQSAEQIKRKDKSLLRVIRDNQPDFFQFNSDQAFLNIGDFEVDDIPKYHFVSRVNGSEPFLGVGYEPAEKVRTKQEVNNFCNRQKNKWNKHYKQVIRELEGKERRAKRCLTEENQSESQTTSSKTSSNPVSQGEIVGSSDSSLTTNW